MMLCLVLMCICFAESVGKKSSPSLLAVSNSDTYAYRYIVELYDAGDAYNLSKEITLFKATYPESVYLPYIRLIEGNLAMESGNYTKAIEIYELLLNIDLVQNVRNDILLNYAYCLSELKQYDRAFNILQRLDSETVNPVYIELSNNLRGDIYFHLGQFYSAEKAYKRAMVAFPDNEGIRFSLFSTYLALDKDDDALELLKAITPESDYYYKYIGSWLGYLLDNELYEDFDRFVEEQKLEDITSNLDIIDIRIRRALHIGDFEKTSQLLQKITIESPQFQYYQALVLINAGKEKQADSLLALLVSSARPEISVPAYMERVKLLFKKNPKAAIEQLNSYLKQTPSDFMKAELYYTMGFFYYNTGNYSEAIRHLGIARHYETSRELCSRIDILIAEAFYASGNNDLAKDTFNRYLNLYPYGSRRDKAYFYLGYMSFQEKDYTQAKVNFQMLQEQYPNSPYCNDATFYLAEMDFYLANYNLALENYLYLYSKKVDNEVVALRITQVYYYLGDYEKSESYIANLVPSYDTCILKGNIMLVKKEYEKAIDQFLQAEKYAPDNLKTIEAKSYRALCLYQMKHFKEASALYLQLSGQKESPDTYLFLAAKSAYAAKDYHLALELYNSFIDKYPESTHFLEALSNIANTYYNMGNYDRAINDWINILTRFRNQTKFTDNQLATIQDALIGLELALQYVNKEDLLAELLVLPDTFFSEYIKFELNYILVKVYANKKLWADLIASAEKMKEDFPQYRQEDVELLMATALIELNEYTKADSLLSELYAESRNNDTLLKWAELEFITGNYESALEKYKLAYKNNPNSEIWVNMLKCSEANNYNEFDHLWTLGIDFLENCPEVNVFRIRQLYYTEHFEEANQLAEHLINYSLSTFDHATAFLVMGMINYRKGEYQTAISTLSKVVMLFPEHKDICSKAINYIVRSLLDSGAYTEAEAFFIQHENELTITDKTELTELLEGI